MTNEVIEENCTVCNSPIKSRGVVSYICTNSKCNTLYVREAWRGDKLFQHAWFEDVLLQAVEMHRAHPEWTKLEFAREMYKLPISSETFDSCIVEIWTDADHLAKNKITALRLPPDTIPFFTKVTAEWQYWIRGYKEKLTPSMPSESASSNPHDDDDDELDDEYDDINEETIGLAYSKAHPTLEKVANLNRSSLRLLERYKAGEHREVWRDMMSLEEAVREEPIYSEAFAVAQETMKRVKKNAETLRDRLIKIKFFDDLIGKEIPSIIPPSKNIQAELAKIESKIGVLPISMRAFCEQVGSITFQGRLKKAMKVKCSYPDPLFVGLLEFIWSDFDNWEVEWYEGCDPLLASIAPDKIHKANVSGGSPYAIYLPNSCADAYVEGDDPYDLMFVDYLRMCFACGGLPGLGVEHRALADKLSKGLLPF